METFRRSGEDFNARRGHAHTVFKLCRKGPVFCNSSPPVALEFDLPLAGIHHGFDREDHAFAELEARAHNGVTVGKGHLAEAKAAVSKEMAGAKSVYQRNGHHDHAGTDAGTAPTQRDELLEKIRENSKIELKKD